MSESAFNKAQVEEPDKVRVHGAHASRPDLPNTGIFYLIGLPGSGKTAVAERLAAALGSTAAELPLEGANEALDALIAKGPAVIAVPHKLLTMPALRERMHETGRVLYLMSDTGSIAARLGKTPEEREELARRLGRQLRAYEPWFMQTLHLLVPASGPLDEVAELALEHARL